MNPANRETFVFYGIMYSSFLKGEQTSGLIINNLLGWYRLAICLLIIIMIILLTIIVM